MTSSMNYKICNEAFAEANDFSFIEQRINACSSYTYDTMLTVVIPYYNEPERLKKTLYGLSRQSIGSDRIEVIVCDDGSDDDISQMLTEWNIFFDCIKYFKEAKKGFRLSRMRNIGLNNASHFNIVILDCDMIPTVNMIEHHIRALKACPYAISIGFRHHAYVDNMSLADLDSLLFRKNDYFELDWRTKICETPDALKEKLKFDSYLAWSIASGGNVGVTKNVLAAEIFFDESFEEWGGEDNEWAYRLFKRGFYFYPNLEAIAIHQDLAYPLLRDKQACLEHLERKCPRAQDAYKKKSYEPSDIPLVSFWMCNNNRAAYIEQAIRSLVSCPYRFEIVIVDDGSVDNSVELINDLRIPQVRLFQKKKGTLGECYKLALDSCRGEIFIQVDSDDFISDMAGLVQMIIVMLSGSYGLVYGHHFLVNQDGSFLKEGWLHPLCDRQRSLFEGMHIHPPRIIHSRDYHRARPIDVSLNTAVDYDLYSKILEVSNGIFVHKDVYAYRQHPSSVSANFEESQKRNIPKIIENRLRHYNFFDKVHFDSSIPRACKTILSNGFSPLDIRNKLSESSK